MAKKKKIKEEIKIKPRPRIRVPHKPTKVHEDRRQYSRKGKKHNKAMHDLLRDMDRESPNEVKMYSLWLMPEGHIYTRLHGLITELSRTNSTPNFEPHITLIGEVIGREADIVAKTSQLATMIRPYTITLTKVEYLDEYFRCLFIRVEETEEIITEHEKVRIFFDLETKQKYIPHLSLMYGNIDHKKKDAIITEIGKNFNIHFEVNAIHLFLTEGDPKDWFRVAKFSLK